MCESVRQKLGHTTVVLIWTLVHSCLHSTVYVVLYCSCQGFIFIFFWWVSSNKTKSAVLPVIHYYLRDSKYSWGWKYHYFGLICIIFLQLTFGKDIVILDNCTLLFCQTGGLLHFADSSYQCKSKTYFDVLTSNCLETLSTDHLLLCTVATSIYIPYDS